MRLINVVGTRATRGEHDQLLRWYADHVHQLMDFEGLLGAALHRRIGNEPSAPDYLCLYDFRDRAAFEAYEHSAVHAQAARDRDAGWGRDGITITLRMQYERLYWCAADAGDALASPDGDQVHALTVHALRTTPSAANERALAAAAVDRKAPVHALLRALVSPSPVADYLLIEQSPTTDAAATAGLQGFEVAWQTAYQNLRRWWR